MCRCSVLSNNDKRAGRRESRGGQRSTPRPDEPKIDGEERARRARTELAPTESPSSGKGASRVGSGFAQTEQGRNQTVHDQTQPAKR